MRERVNANSCTFDSTNFSKRNALFAADVRERNAALTLCISADVIPFAMTSLLNISPRQRYPCTNEHPDMEVSFRSANMGSRKRER